MSVRTTNDVLRHCRCVISTRLIGSNNTARLFDMHIYVGCVRVRGSTSKSARPSGLHAITRTFMAVGGALRVVHWDRYSDAFVTRTHRDIPQR